MNREPNIDFLLNPTPAEYRNMVYQYIMSNVKGIMPYTFIDGFNFLPNLPSLQNEFAAVNVEIAALAQVFLSGGYQRITTFNSNTNIEYYPDLNGVQASTWYNANTGNTYVIVANTKSTENLPVNVQMPATTVGLPTSVFANRPSGLVYNSTTKILSGAVNAKDVHVYKFSTSVLPYNDINFSVKNINSKVTASWNKQSDVSKYELEKSNDGISFQIVQDIMTSAVNNKYMVTTSEVDYNVYYRLKIVKLNMNVEYSDIILNRNNCSGIINFSAINNDCCVDLKITTTKEENISVSIFNNIGQRFGFQKKYLAIGQNTISLQKINMPSGFYIAKILHDITKMQKEIKFSVQ